MKDDNNLTPAGAAALKGKLERYWQNLSSAGAVRFWLEREGTDEHNIWVIRSSLVGGLPGPLINPVTPASTSNTAEAL